MKLQAEGRGGELGDGALHSLLVKKFADSRWLREHKKGRSVFSLRDWLKEEVRIRVKAVEMARGIEADTVGAAMDSGKQVDKGGRIRNLFSEGNNFGKEPAVPTSKPPCVYCRGNHGVWNCRRFQNMGANERWNVARDKRLCFRCLASEGRACTKARPFYINGCKRNHHHFAQGNTKDGRVVSAREGAPAHTHPSTSKQETVTETFSLRTVPVWLKANDRKMKVTLGISWNSTEHTFTISAANISTELPVTKRIVLRKVATVFDPLGFVGPFVIKAKILLQKSVDKGL